ncbi:signal recognition particle-docking protein FtsY [Desulfovibrio sp. OttesenSCG-928-I05]|nr:signal recognition particle-docking protein FtsY [Desulfovibrio sp. OttesenSCG-928-I05]
MGLFSSIKKLWGGGRGASGEAAGPAAVSYESSAQDGAWRDALLLSLREAEPRLSLWLGHVLEGVPEAGPQLWERLAFFFDALEVPAAERDTFIASFSSWLDTMGYRAVEEFRSELQYRLALALDLEDEEDERNRLLLKLSDGLSRTREQIGRNLDALFSSHDTITDALWEEMEEVLIAADVGVNTALELTARLRRRAQRDGVTDPAGLRDLLREELTEVFKPMRRIQAVNPPEVVLVIGVNGVGKTTTIAKLAHRATLQGRKVLIAAADTFRAAAIEQLEVWAKRVGAGFHAKEANSDPAAVAFEAVDKAVAEGYDLLLVDTAGRLHTKTNLMEELTKISRVLGKRHPGAPHRTILVVDATTGQNALSQAKLFNEAAAIDEVILTKLDGTAKGGIVVAVAMQFGLPITFVGLGEKMEDLRPFDGEQFARALFDAATPEE